MFSWLQIFHRMSDNLAEYLSKKGFSEPLTEQTKEEIEADVRSVVVTQHVLQFVPEWFRSEKSWLASP